MPLASQLRAKEADFELAVLHRLGPVVRFKELETAAVPNRHRAAAVLALGNDARELFVA